MKINSQSVNESLMINDGSFKAQSNPKETCKERKLLWTETAQINLTILARGVVHSFNPSIGEAGAGRSLEFQDN